MAAFTYIAVAALSGIAGLFVGGTVGALAAEWYRVPAFEGEAGYFVVFLALLGFMAGLAIAVIATAIMRRRGHGFWRALGASLATIVVAGGAAAGGVRVLADIPPLLDGEPMLLALDVRWPAGAARPVAAGRDEPSLTLYSIPFYSNVVRAREQGPLWLEDARQVDGRWVAPGAVSVFTGRGSRVVAVDIGDGNRQAFKVPLPGSPGAATLAWSEWGPQYRQGVAEPPDALSYRWRVVKASEPVRVQQIGAFEVAIKTAGFYRDQRDGGTAFAAHAAFGLSFNGAPVAGQGLDNIGDVAVIGGARTALMLHVDPYGENNRCVIAADDGGRLRIVTVGQCYRGFKGRLLTNEAAQFARGDERPLEGRIDRTSYATPGLYLMDNAVLDTRTLAVRRISGDVLAIPAVAPLGVSPDERSFVRFANSDAPRSEPILAVTDTVADRTYSLAIDPRRMRYPKFAALGPAWLDHHFAWQRDGSGVDVLTERPDFVPLPYSGETRDESYGGRTYRIEKGTAALREALVAFLVAEFGAQREPAEDGAYEVPVTIAGRTVGVFYSSEFHYVAVALPPNSDAGAPLISTIGERFNAALASGRYDDLFGTEGVE